MTNRKGLVDEAMARDAIRFALPTIELMLQRSEVSGEGVLHIVVMDPQSQPGTCAFDDAILVEHSVGDPGRWGADYRGFARRKAALAWRLGRDTQEVQEQSPHLLARGDSLLWGTAVRDGLVVAASGAHPWFDAAFCAIVASVLLALAQDRARAARSDGLSLPD